MGKILGKRQASTKRGAVKKQKVAPGSSSNKSNVKGKGKGHAYERDVIPMPQAVEEADSDAISEGDLEFFAEHIDAAGGFVRNLDEKGIARSKKEQMRLHMLHKPQRRVPVEDDLPSIESHSEDEGEWSSGVDDDDLAALSYDEGNSVSSSISGRKRSKPRKDSDDEEMLYEAQPRKRRKSWDSEEEAGIERLPIKLQNGKIKHSGVKVEALPQSEEDDESSEEEIFAEEPVVVEDVSTGARFGRPAIADVMTMKSRKAKVQAAKEQIASICQDIIADPENGLGLLRRLNTFSLPEFSTPSHPKPVPNDPVIRKLAMLSQLAVFKDIIPGYRIRPLTDKEKAEKVSQIVQRARDFEQGLVSVYQSYLRTLEAELKAKSELSEVALQCICRLLTELTHFNFRVNLMTAVVSRLSKKSWDESSELCLKTLSAIFRADKTGQPSLEIVRLLNRMIKERHFNVHPNVMFCLLDLRLKTELGGVRASQSKADKEKPTDTMSKGKAAQRRAKGKAAPTPHLSKKAKKKFKETQAIEEEMREAEAEVDREERVTVQTETLKLLFVLYFRILKNEKPSPLLPSALQGISRFAHLVNIDFFKDLLEVLRGLVSRNNDSEEVSDNQEDQEDGCNRDVRAMHHRLQCIVTAFELLSGQGEALNIDLTDFVNLLYSLIPPLSITRGIESPVIGIRSARKVTEVDTPSRMLFRALNLAFSPRAPSSARPPPWRSAAFAKRLVTASLHFPPPTAIQALDFVRNLLAREPKVEALLSTEDRISDGIYRPEIDDPQLCNPFATNFWELQLLFEHVNEEVRQAAVELIQFSRDQS